jgi:membrane protein
MQTYSAQLFGQIVKDSVKIFRSKDPLRMASSTAYFMVFAMPPVLIIMTNVFGIIFNEEIVSGALTTDLEALFGPDAAYQLMFILGNFQDITQNLLLTVAGGVFLTFTATTFLMVVQKSLNDIWNIKQRTGIGRRSLLIQLKHRIIALAIILVTGALVLASLLYDTVIAFLGSRLDRLFPQLDDIFVHWASHTISVVVIALWFAMLFKYLPDVRVHWKAVIIGSLVTAVLFEVGKYLLGRLLVNGDITTFYGAAGSIVLLLLFIFYASMIFYFGACFTKAYARHMHLRVEPKRYAAEYEIRELPRVVRQMPGKVSERRV